MICTMFSTAECDDGNVKLLEGSGEATSGQVEVCVNKRWATMCIERENNATASTVCRQLGFDIGNFQQICTLTL